MSENCSILDYENIVQEEYEVQHYGFSINQFTEENFLFVENQIKNSMKDLKQKLLETIKDIKPHFSDEISKITDEVCDEILKNAKEDTAKINKIITEKFKIPENILLYSDHAQLKMVTKEQNDQLQQNIDQLEKLAKQNAFFINGLNNELNAYDQFEEVFCTSTFVSEKAEEQLNCNFSMDVISNYLKKIQNL